MKHGIHDNTKHLTFFFWLGGEVGGGGWGIHSGHNTRLYTYSCIHSFVTNLQQWLVPQMFLLIAQTSMKPCVGIWSFWWEYSEVEMDSFFLATFVFIEQVVCCCTVWQAYRHKMRQQECPVCLSYKCLLFALDFWPQLVFWNESIIAYSQVPHACAFGYESSVWCVWLLSIKTYEFKAAPQVKNTDSIILYTCIF